MSIRIAVTGKTGQVVRALCETKETEIEIIPVGRPELDLNIPETIGPALRAIEPDVIVNAAAYTAVDLAEKEVDLASLINAEGPAHIARIARELKIPLIHLSTDYVFGGNKRIFTEKDRVRPRNVYGMTKLIGEKAVASATPDHVILRTSWLYAPYGKNFVRTMLRLASVQEEIRVVNDQFGTPTYAPDLADAIIKIAFNLLSYGDPELRGVFHFSGSGKTISWASFAKEIFSELADRGLPTAKIIPISSAEYPTAAERPVNSRLNCSKLKRVHQIVAPDWIESLGVALLEIIQPSRKSINNA